MRFRFLLAICALSFGALLDPAAAQAPRKLTYAHYLAANQGTLVEIDAWFMDEVTKRTNGRVTFERYYSGTLLKAVDIMPGVGAKAADIGTGAPGAYNRRDYPISSITLPFISSKLDSVIKSYRELYDSNDSFRKEYESRGVKLLYAPAYAENAVWSTKPIATPAQLKGLKIRALLSVGDVFAKLGASPVAMPWHEAIEGMQRGVIDAMSAAPIDTAVRGGLHEVAKYGGDVGDMGIYAMSTTVINLEVWNSLDPETQKVMQEVAAEMPQHYLKTLNADMDIAVGKLIERAKGGKFELQLFSEADAKRMRETVGKEVWQEWVQTVNKSGSDGQKILDEFIALTQKYDKLSDYESGFSRLRRATK